MKNQEVNGKVGQQNRPEAQNKFIYVYIESVYA